MSYCLLLELTVFLENPPVWIRRLDNGKTTTVDPLSIDTWNEYKWPKQLPAKLEGDRQNYIANYLNQAKQFLCDVVQFKPEANNLDVWRLVGTNGKGRSSKTLCGITFSSGGIKNEKCDGDGTVPAWVASEHSLRNMVPEEDQEHTALFNHRSFRDHLEEFFQTLHLEWMQKSVDEKSLSKNQLGDIYAAAGSMVPSAPENVGVTAERGKSLAAEIEKLVVEKTPGLSPRDIFRQGDFRASSVSRTKRAAALRAYLDLDQQDPYKDPWALNNAAHIYLQKQEFGAAKDLAELAIESADALQAPQAREIKKKSALIAALAAEQLGDSNSSLNFRQIAKEEWDVGRGSVQRKSVHRGNVTNLERRGITLRHTSRKHRSVHGALTIKGVLIRRNRTAASAIAFQCPCGA
jgi:tetratricopeptide (TPR) repeat protein